MSSKIILHQRNHHLWKGSLSPSLSLHCWPWFTVSFAYYDVFSLFFSLISSLSLLIAFQLIHTFFSLFFTLGVCVLLIMMLSISVALSFGLFLLIACNLLVLTLFLFALIIMMCLWKCQMKWESEKGTTFKRLSKFLFIHHICLISFFFSFFYLFRWTRQKPKQKRN